MTINSEQEDVESQREAPKGVLPGLLLDEVYEQLHRLARAQMAKERADHTLQPTALVNEAYMRLFGDQDVSWESRRQFYGTACKVMRSLLVDHARGRNAKKRGGQRMKVSLEHADSLPLHTEQGDFSRQIDILDLHASLERLAHIDQGMADAVELRYFGGLSIKETAASLGVPLRTTERRLQTAGMWLRDDLAS